MLKSILYILAFWLVISSNKSLAISTDPPPFLDYTTDEILRAINITYSPGVTYLNGVGVKLNNAFSLRFRGKSHWNYLFMKFNYLNGIENKSSDAFTVVNYKQFSPVHNYNNFSLGYGNYVFSKLHDNVNYHFDIAVGFSSNKVTVSDSITKTEFMNYSIGVGTSQKITNQLRIGYSFNVYAPFKSDFLSRKEAILNKTFSNMVYNLEFSLQFLFFEKND